MKQKILFAAIMLLSGCATLNGTSYEDGTLPPEATLPVAEDASGILAEQYPPGQTTIILNPAGSFGEQLIAGLRKKGFAVIDTGTPTLHYLIESLDTDAQTLHLGLITADRRNDVLYRKDGGIYKQASQSRRSKP